MNKQPYNNLDETQDIAYLVKVGLVAVLLISACGFGGYQGYQYWNKQKVVNLEQDTLVFIEAAQKYVDLNKNFLTNIDTKKHGNEYIRSILPSSFKGANITHSLGGDTVVGLTGMSGVPNHELYLTFKDVPVKHCVPLVLEFNKNLPVIAVGEPISTAEGVNTGMFVKSNYAQRELNESHLIATCTEKAGVIGKVNITVWATSQTDLITKNTVMGTKEGMDKKK